MIDLEHIEASPYKGEEPLSYQEIDAIVEWIKSAHHQLTRYLQQNIDDLIHGDVDEDKLRNLISQIRQAPAATMDKV